ncbi:MAG TPA: EamA family transporter [Acidimicrobiales bacterium]|nr:EamA family transporter [Acidimicrobiales bacterium]
MPRLLALSFIWGWSFLFIKVAGQDLTPTAVAWGRCLLGAAALLAVVRLQGLTLPRDRRSLGHFLVVGATGSAVPFSLLAWGEQHIASGLTAVLNASTPLFTAGLAVPLLRERLRPQVVAGLAVGLVGVGVVAGVGRSDLAGTEALAVAAPVVAGLFYGLTFCWAARHLMGLPAVVAATGQVLGATVLLAPVAVATSVSHGTMPGPRQIGSLVMLGLVGTGVAYVLSFRIIAELGATVASLCTYVIPVVALGVGAVVLDERVGVRTLVGGAVIAASVALVTRARQPPADPTGPPSGRSAPLPLPDAAPPPPAGPVPPARRRALGTGVVLALAATTALAGCGAGGSDGDTACGPVRREPLDRRSVHVLPGAGAVEYRTDPPTSGPHLATPSTTDVRDTPLAPEVQVGLLEEGGVLLQHTGLDATARDAVEALAGEGVVVAPAPDLPEGAVVVATAWVTKQSCPEVDVATLRRFTADHVDRGPAHG